VLLSDHDVTLDHDVTSGHGVTSAAAIGVVHVNVDAVSSALVAQTLERQGIDMAGRPVYNPMLGRAFGVWIAGGGGSRDDASHSGWTRVNSTTLSSEAPALEHSLVITMLTTTNDTANTSTDAGGRTGTSIHTSRRRSGSGGGGNDTKNSSTSYTGRHGNGRYRIVFRFARFPPICTRELCQIAPSPLVGTVKGLAVPAGTVPSGCGTVPSWCGTVPSGCGTVPSGGGTVPHGVAPSLGVWHSKQERNLTILSGV
jgi:hypothetical protein